jgi:hypothetical protein
MKPTFSYSLLASVVSLGLSLISIAPPPINAQDHHHHPSGTPHSPNQPGSTGHSHGEKHTHKAVAIPPGQPIPTVNLVVRPDAMRGWNLELRTTNFTFAPERVNTKGTTTEGHAHLYLNGKKLSRLYGSWHHLAELPPGHHKLTVTLNTNTHEELTVNGKRIEGSTIIQVPAR